MSVRGTSHIAPVGSQSRAQPRGPPAGPDLRQLFLSTGTWEDVETRPCGSSIASGFQVARAFQDVSEELNQGTLL